MQCWPGLCVVLYVIPLCPGRRHEHEGSVEVYVSSVVRRSSFCRNFGAWPAEKNAAMTISGATSLAVDDG